jgi:hypothetical protein
MVGGTNYLSPLNQLQAPFLQINLSISIPYIVFHQNFTLPAKWAKSVNLT